LLRLAAACLGRFEDALLGFVSLSGDAFDVYTHWYVYGVACPFGDLGRVRGGLKSCRCGSGGGVWDST
jgi:hypothetical protein